MRLNIYLICSLLVGTTSVFGFSLRGDAVLDMYNNHQYEEAYTAYTKRLRWVKDESDVQYCLGATAYRMGKFELAKEHFQKSRAKSYTRTYSRGTYSLANACYRTGQHYLSEDSQRTIHEWKQAIELYASIRSTDMEFNKARGNLRFVRRKLEELEAKLNKESKPGDDSNTAKEPNNQAPSGGSHEKDQSPSTMSMDASQPMPNQTPANQLSEAESESSQALVQLLNSLEASDKRFPQGEAVGSSFSKTNTHYKDW